MNNFFYILYKKSIFFFSYSILGIFKFSPMLKLVIYMTSAVKVRKNIFCFDKKLESLGKTLGQKVRQNKAGQEIFSWTKI